MDDVYQQLKKYDFFANMDFSINPLVDAEDKRYKKYSLSKIIKQIKNTKSA